MVDKNQNCNDSNLVHHLHHNHKMPGVEATVQVAAVSSTTGVVSENMIAIRDQMQKEDEQREVGSGFSKKELDGLCQLGP